MICFGLNHHKPPLPQYTHSTLPQPYHGMPNPQIPNKQNAIPNPLSKSTLNARNASSQQLYLPAWPCVALPCLVPRYPNLLSSSPHPPLLLPQNARWFQNPNNPIHLIISSERQMIQKPQHQHHPNNQPTKLQHSDFIPTRRHARQPSRGAFEAGAEGRESFALGRVRKAGRCEVTSEGRNGPRSHRRVDNSLIPRVVVDVDGYPAEC